MIMTLVCKQRVIAKSLDTGRLVPIMPGQSVRVHSKAKGGYVVRTEGHRLLVDEPGMKNLHSL